MKCVSLHRGCYCCGRNHSSHCGGNSSLSFIMFGHCPSEPFVRCFDVLHDRILGCSSSNIMVHINGFGKLVSSQCIFGISLFQMYLPHGHAQFGKLHRAWCPHDENRFGNLQMHRGIFIILFRRTYDTSGCMSGCQINGGVL